MSGRLCPTYDLLMTESSVSPRRTFLRSAGVSLALPLLESAGQCFEGGAETKAKRLVCVGTYLGIHRPAFFPRQLGENYAVPEILRPIESFRSQFTIISGLDHRAGNGHRNWHTYLTGALGGNGGSFRSDCRRLHR